MVDNSQNNPPANVGQELKSARIEKGLTLEIASKTLRISKRHLVSIEEDCQNLICDVYTLGFLKSYAQYLGLNEKELSAKFKDQACPSEPSHLTFPAPLPGKGMPSPRILGLSIFALLAIILGWRWIGEYHNEPAIHEDTITLKAPPQETKETKNASLTQSPSVLDKLPVEASSSTIIEKPATTPSSSQTVLLKTTEEAWIEVKDTNNNIILRRLFAPGESYEFKNPYNLLLKTGNAKGILLISGEKTHTLSGVVESNISLDPEKWVEQIPETH